MKKLILLVAVALMTVACADRQETKNQSMSSISSHAIDRAVEAVLASPEASDIDLIERGVNSAAAVWTEADGTEADFVEFCRTHYVADSAGRAALFARLDRQLENIRGHYDLIYVNFMFPLHVVGDTVLDVDNMFAGYDPFAHFDDDMFGTKIAFVALLNFPVYSLAEKNELGADWSRRQWAYARMGDWFASRIPADVSMAFTEINSRAGTYIESYDIKMGALRTERGEQIFPDGMSLISHWNLRDQLKTQYADSSALARERQEMIYQVMLRIIDQTIPATVINNEKPLWYPYSNKVTDRAGKTLKADREADVRYQYLIDEFQACRRIDKYCPAYPTAVARAFARDMEVSDTAIEKMFTDYLLSKQSADVVALIRRRLGRDLRPYDIWYDGFKARSAINVDELNAKTRALYPSPEAFHQDMANILVKLGFDRDKAAFIQSQVEVDPSRSAGHAWTSQAKFEKSRLRTRIQPEGFDYLGYNIACHEFGHNVEQTISIQDVDYYSMARVPSSAFTEALAFVFQKRDLDLLGYTAKDPASEALQTLDIFWNAYEMMGVSLLDLYTWRWMYANPDCTAAQLREYVVATATDLWNKYYAPYFGVKDSPILAIYSHMISYPLYLANYAYGTLVEAQLESYLADKVLGPEICRIYQGGRLTPDHWMINATGQPVSIEPLLRQTAEALEQLK